MPENITPRLMIKGLLDGISPPRPLFLPIVFSHAAAIANLPLRIFLSNPTKIVNSLRQIRAHLRADGITCYFDPYLEAEALGAVLGWDAEGRAEPPRWPQDVAGEPLASAAEPPTGGRVAVAIEVIKRLKIMVRDDCLLTAAVTGPFTLAAMLSQPGSGTLRRFDIDASALDLAYAVASGIAKAFAEAGANVIFIREENLPALSADECAEWASRLGATINIIRFYQSLPVLLLTEQGAVRRNRDVISREPWNCLLCPAWGAMPGFQGAPIGVALDPESLRGDRSHLEALTDSLRATTSGSPAIITTTSDVESAADVERLRELWENVRH
jgi:hypothetical protein